MESVRLTRVENFVNLLHNEEYILNCMACIMMIIAVTVFVVLLFISAPYGRYSSSKWGPLIDAKYAWFLQEISALVIPVFFWFYHSEAATTNKIFLLCFIIHYIHRGIIYPLFIVGGKPTPFIPFSMALVFCVYNGYMQAKYLLLFSSFPEDWLMSSFSITGLVLFFTGMFINIHSDHILRNLRRPGETGYKIPRGGAFEYVSGANFFGEIVEWWGFALLTQTLPALAFAIFTMCNLAPRAISHHRWYLGKFEDYPKKRKAVIPFVI